MKIGMIGVLGVLLALQFKSEKTEYGLYIGVTICLLIFWFCMEQMVHLVGKWRYFPNTLREVSRIFCIL